MKASGTRLQKQIRPNTSAKGVQETFGVKEITATTLALGTQAPSDPPSSSNVDIPSSSTSATPTASNLSPALNVADFSNTIPDQISDLVHIENAATQVDLLYSGDSNFGPNARIYLVRFDFGLFPTRQHRWKVPIHYFMSGLSNTYDFRKQWHAEVELRVPTFEKGESQPDKYTNVTFSERDVKNSLIYFYDLEPKYSALTAIEGLSNASQFQLIASYLSPEGSGQLDYTRRLDELLNQQRRYPMQMGMLQSPTAATFTFGPRRVIVERGLLSRLNPFSSRYKITRQLEPGTRTVHAIIVIPDVEEFEQAYKNVFDEKAEGFTSEALFRPNTGDYGTQSQSNLVDDFSYSQKVLEKVTPTVTKTDKLRKIHLPIQISASYLKQDLPGDKQILPIYGEKKDKGGGKSKGKDQDDSTSPDKTDGNDQDEECVSGVN